MEPSLTLAVSLVIDVDDDASTASSSTCSPSSCSCSSLASPRFIKSKSQHPAGDCPRGASAGAPLTTVKPLVWFITTNVSLAAFVYGYDVGGSSGALIMEAFQDFFGWSGAGASSGDHRDGGPPPPPPQWVAEQQGWIIGIFFLGGE